MLPYIAYMDPMGNGRFYLFGAYYHRLKIWLHPTPALLGHVRHPANVRSKHRSKPPSDCFFLYDNLNWLVVSTPLTNISQLGLFFPIYGKKHVPSSKAPTSKIVLEQMLEHMMKYEVDIIIFYK